MHKKRLFALAQEFCNYLIVIRGLSEHTAKAYEQTLRKAVASSHLIEQDERYILDIMPYREAIVHLKKKSIARHLSALRSFIKYLHKYHQIPIEVENDSTIKVPKTLPKPIDKVYIKEVLAQATAQERLILLMLYGLGLRISELAALQVGQITHEWVVVWGKGGKERQIPLPLVVQRALQSYLASFYTKSFLFEKEGKPYTVSQLRYRVQKAFRRCGIKATPHQLRHSFATHILQEGARIADVSKLLGHSTMATTQVYTKLAHTTKLKQYRQAHPLVKQGAKGL